jgi:hypothetical protein
MSLEQSLTNAFKRIGLDIKGIKAQSWGTSQLFLDENYTGTQYGFPQLGDNLNVVIAKLNNSATSIALLPEFTVDPVDPSTGKSWIFHVEPVAGGKLLSMFGATPILKTGVEESYSLRVKTSEKIIEFKEYSKKWDYLEEFVDSSKSATKIGDKWIEVISGVPAGILNGLFGAIPLLTVKKDPEVYLKTLTSVGVYKVKMEAA